MQISGTDIHQILTSPGGRDWWTRHAARSLTPEFRRAIEELLAAKELEKRS